jgi:hypothetical protein
MSARDSDRELDDLLRDDGGDVGSLYKRLPRYEPPRRLDRAVLGEAARAIHSGKPPRRQRWIVGVGSAAGIVLAAGIAWRIGHDPFGAGTTPAAAPTVVPVQPISESTRAKHAESKASADADRNDAATPDKTAAPSAGNLAAPAPAQRAEPAPQRKTRVAAKPPASMPASAAPAPPPVAEMQAAPPETPNDRARERESMQSVDDKHAAGASSDAASNAQPFAGGAAKRDPAPSSSRMAPALSAPSGSVELARDTQLAPQDWLAHIGQLARHGRTQQATESLRLFHRAHPDWVIPDELAPLLK